MSDIFMASRPAGLRQAFGNSRESPVRVAAAWLSLAAAPTFAVMALLTGIHGADIPDMLCSAARHPSPLNGMVPMYLLMSAFHLAPWLKLISPRYRSRIMRSGREPISRDVKEQRRREGY